MGFVLTLVFGKEKLYKIIEALQSLQEFSSLMANAKIAKRIEKDALESIELVDSLDLQKNL